MASHPHHPHDHSYKLLFSHPEMVRDLLTGFVKEAWVEQLDFSTLEKVSGSYITEDLRDREDDVIWRVRWGDDWLYVYLLLEFQSSVDRFMAVRVMTYLGLLYQDLIRQEAFTPNGKLPPVLPIVLYNGEKRWTAAQNVANLVEQVPGGLERYRPDLAYLLLDEGAVISDPEWSDHMRNVAAALFRLEHNRDEQDMLEVLGTLVEWLKAPEQTGLRRAFVVWIRRVLLPNRTPGMELPEFNELQDLHEVHDMLAERIKQWPERWEEKGRQEGRQEGRKEGRQEGEQRGIEKTARNLIKLGVLSDEQIAEATGLTVAEVEGLREEDTQ
ncbi:Rpn family recombination-promoting nuclease/putative transposase [Chromohalobacter israelensis]|uniref:Rpn family recombination-promoting nuclease/putative transposase n=1 Tax=Chromohalobacter israelensis TaxID=141390 RepID=UPI000D71A069|nr:Rpn family recombination-promoting nuclease/putative transposase [Chromohalobacter salexigens]PWW31468.1 putative transposase/invertase (TIGR01784 family) [Chromohalobacter salexigens]